MRNALRFLVLFSLIFTFVAVQFASAQDNGTLVDVIGNDGRLTRMSGAINSAELNTMLSSSGPYTIFAPTDAAFAVLADDSLTNANAIRSTVLHHTLQSAKNSGNLSVEPSLTNALGKQLSVSQNNGKFMLNGTATVIVTDIVASNGILHIIDVVLNPNPQQAAPAAQPAQPAPADDGAAAPPPEPVEQQPAAMPENNLVLTDPSQNPAYKGEGHMAYWSGIQSDRTTCKGTTWVVMLQMDGVTYVGSDRQTNPYRGDTNCGTPLPMLCFLRDFSNPPPASSRGHDYSNGWAGGKVRATVPVTGAQLNSLGAANQLCAQTFGAGWRMASFHDAAYGAQVGEISGWDFWAYGGLNNNQRYWVHVGDQPANPWDSVQPHRAPELNSWVDQVAGPGGDSAYVVGEKMMPNYGLSAGRPMCKGVTWVIEKQMDGMVLVGSDALTNPYTGDTNCDQRLPILCIRVEGFTPPANTNGNNYSESWSGGQVGQTYPFSGHEINTREKANQKCVDTFGSGWRIMEFHDGALGTAGTDGWKAWAYGGLNTGRRMWISINDQPANPWNPHAGGN